MATEREELEESIRKGETAYEDLRNRHNSERHHMRRLVDAARKHLETLPKPKPLWRVTGTLPNGYRAPPYETDSHQGALNVACAWLRHHGYTNVSVRQVQS